MTDQASTAPKQKSASQREDMRLPQQVELEKSKVAPGYYKPIPEETLVTWSAPARPFKKREKQFFSTVFIIALLVALILFFAGQGLPVALVIAIVFFIYISETTPPQQVAVKLTNYGIYVDKDAYAWYEMGRFWFEKKRGFETLQIELGRFPSRLSLVLIKDETPAKKDLEMVLSEVLLKEKPKPTAFEKVSKWLGEKIPLD